MTQNVYVSIRYLDVVVTTRVGCGQDHVPLLKSVTSVLFSHRSKHGMQVDHSKDYRHLMISCISNG